VRLVYARSGHTHAERTRGFCPANGAASHIGQTHALARKTGEMRLYRRVATRARRQVDPNDDLWSKNERPERPGGAR
jgi:hypothetical protein